MSPLIVEFKQALGIQTSFRVPAIADNLAGSANTARLGDKDAPVSLLYSHIDLLSSEVIEPLPVHPSTKVIIPVGWIFLI